MRTTSRSGSSFRRLSPVESTWPTWAVSRALRVAVSRAACASQGVARHSTRRGMPRTRAPPTRRRAAMRPRVPRCKTDSSSRGPGRDVCKRSRCGASSRGEAYHAVSCLGAWRLISRRSRSYTSRCNSPRRFRRLCSGRRRRTSRRCTRPSSSARRRCMEWRLARTCKCRRARRSHSTCNPDHARMERPWGLGRSTRPGPPGRNRSTSSPRRVGIRRRRPARRRRCTPSRYCKRK